MKSDTFTESDKDSILCLKAKVCPFSVIAKYACDFKRRGITPKQIKRVYFRMLKGKETLPSFRNSCVSGTKWTPWDIRMHAKMKKLKMPLKHMARVLCRTKKEILNHG